MLFRWDRIHCKLGKRLIGKSSLGHHRSPKVHWAWKELVCLQISLHVKTAFCVRGSNKTKKPDWISRQSAWLLWNSSSRINCPDAVWCWKTTRHTVGQRTSTSAVKELLWSVIPVGRNDLGMFCNCSLNISLAGSGWRIKTSHYQGIGDPSAQVLHTCSSAEITRQTPQIKPIDNVSKILQTECWLLFSAYSQIRD